MTRLIFTQRSAPAHPTKNVPPRHSPRRGSPPLAPLTPLTRRTAQSEGPPPCRKGSGRQNEWLTSSDAAVSSVRAARTSTYASRTLSKGPGASPRRLKEETRAAVGVTLRGGTGASDLRGCSVTRALQTQLKARACQVRCCNSTQAFAGRHTSLAATQHRSLRPPHNLSTTIN